MCMRQNKEVHHAIDDQAINRSADDWTPKEYFKKLR